VGQFESGPLPARDILPAVRASLGQSIAQRPPYDSNSMIPRSKAISRIRCCGISAIAPPPKFWNAPEALHSSQSKAANGAIRRSLYFSYDSDYYWDRQEVLNRLQLVQLPMSLSPQLSPWSPIGEIYRYRLYGPNFSLNELKATENWFVTREIKQVSGIIDVTSFGGSRSKRPRIAGRLNPHRIG
jgi:AcrB/AcrD/AcrF family